MFAFEPSKQWHYHFSHPEPHPGHGIVGALPNQP
jgi:hypothetical protein